MSTTVFRSLVLARWLTVAQAAEKYGVCDRTVRMWLASWPISAKICDRAYRVSEPLLDLCVSDDPDERAAVADFLAGSLRGRSCAALSNVAVCSRGWTEQSNWPFARS
jgi:hypothetical protein